jgi:hypothetical protein
VFLIFSNSLQSVRIGLVAALWAAVIGAVAATRYRREATIDQAKAHDLQQRYQQQLDRELGSRREYELDVEARVREEVGAESAELAALRAELVVLRENLQRLFEGAGMEQRTALHADAFRIQELPSASANGNRLETDWDPWNAAPVSPMSMTPIFEPDHPEPPAFASPYDDPVTVETSAVPPEEQETRHADPHPPDMRFPSFDPHPSGTFAAYDRYSSDSFEPFGQPPASRARPHIGPNPAAGHATEPHDLPAAEPAVGRRAPDRLGVPAEPDPFAPDFVSSGRFAADTFVADHFAAARSAADPLNAGDGPTAGDDRPADRPNPAAGQAQPPFAPQPAQDRTDPPIGTAGARRRRRAENEEGGAARQLSVAEIMANLRSERNGTE